MVNYLGKAAYGYGPMRASTGHCRLGPSQTGSVTTTKVSGMTVGGAPTQSSNGQPAKKGGMIVSPWVCGVYDMKAKQPFFVLCALLLGIVGCDGYVSSCRLMPSSSNETSFFQSYDPEQVLKAFREPWGYSSGHPNGSSNGIKSILHNQGFTPGFAMPVSRKQELLDALCEDVLLHLRYTGMTVVASYRESDGGLTYKYKSGSSVGKISVHPPYHDAYMRRNMALPSGLDDVRLNILIEETWTRPASETPWWMSMVD
jgi:hypothetical protein